MTYKIRRARPSDAVHIVTALEKVYPLTDDVRLKAVKNKIRQIRDHIVFVAEADGLIIGSGALVNVGKHEEKTVYEMCNLFVVPEYRDQGIGRALVTARLKLLSDKTDYVLIAHVRGREPKAQHLMYSSGMFPLGIIPSVKDFGENIKEALIPFSSYKVIPGEIDPFLESYFCPIKFEDRQTKNIEPCHQIKNEKKKIRIPLERATLFSDEYWPTNVVISNKIMVEYMKKDSPVSLEEFVLTDELKEQNPDNGFVSYYDLFFRIYYNLGCDKI